MGLVLDVLMKNVLWVLVILAQVVNGNVTTAVCAGLIIKELPMLDLKNRELWDQLFLTDPSQTTTIEGKEYKGTSTHPYWLTFRCTEVFGPCGDGWGFSIKNQGFEALDQETKLHWAMVQFWYMRDGKKCLVEHMGSTKAVYRTAGNANTPSKMKYDEEAPKKSVTDALVKCMSQIGLTGDIHSKLWNTPGHQQRAREFHQYLQTLRDKNYAEASTRSEEQNTNSQTMPPRDSNQENLKTYSRDELESILVSVQTAQSFEQLNKIYKLYKNTPIQQTVYNACQSKRKDAGWMQKQ